MTRLRLFGLLAVLALLAGAVSYGGHDRPEATAEDAVDLAPLRAAAGLAPCPTGLGPDLPPVALPCLGGGPDVRLDAAPSGPMLVNVWGTWCPPCVDEVPTLVDFAARAEGRVAVLGVLTSDTEQSALTFAQTFGMRYPNVVDDDGLVRARYGGGTPLTLLLDGEGTVVHVESGQLADAAELDALVARHLGVRV